MASKVCPNCGAKNPKDAYSCQECAASLIELPAANVPNQSNVSTNKSWNVSSSAYSSPSDKPIAPDEAMSSPSYSNSPPPPVSTSAESAGQPLAVVRQSPLSGILNALVSSVFFLIFGFGAGLANTGALVSILYFVAVVGIPVIIGYFMRPRYSFYDSYFVKEARGGSQRFDYSQIESIRRFRGSMRVMLKPMPGFRNRPLSIPGDPKISGGSNLADFLESRVVPKHSADDQEQNTP